jgi:predicted DCC family thiol-disulfide oxidoreductase YuxK
LEDVRHGTAIRQRDLIAPLVVIDGDCALCAWSVDFIRTRSAPGRFRFVARDAPEAAAELAPFPAAAGVDGVVLLADGRAYVRSEAALRIAACMRAPWPAATLLRWLPRRLRDAAYGVVARNRYRWFGRLTGG